MKNKLPTTWDLSDFGKKHNDPKFKRERLVMQKKYKSFAAKWKKNQSYLTNASVLKKALDQYEKLSNLTDNEGSYLFFVRQIDSGNKIYTAAEKKYIEFVQKLSDEIRFFGLSLGKILPKHQKVFLKDKKLADYKHFLEGIFETAKYQLSEPEERILSLKSGVSHGNWDSMIEETFANESAKVLTKGKGYSRTKKIQTFSEMTSLTSSDCKRVRRSSAMAIEKILKKHSFFVEKEFNSILENKKINDELRGYKRADESRAISDDISLEIVDVMTNIVTENFKISREYYSLKAKLLKKDKLSYHERNIPVSSVYTEYSYKKSVNLVKKALEKIDPEFAEIHINMCESGKVDVYPKSGKRGGAFCMYHEKNAPVYIMLNHTGIIRDVSTLAHEMGHAIHGTLIKGENALNYDTPTFMAEIASTFCEEHTFDLLTERAKDKEKLGLYMQKIGDTVTTIFRQVAAYNFEREIHDRFRELGYVSAEEIGKIFKKNMAAYMGNSILQDYGTENSWMPWHHFRRPFYVYSYASGLLLANGMMSVLKNNPERWEDVKKFFYTGTSKSPQQTFKEMGIDITDKDFWEGGMLGIKKLLVETKKLAKKLGKIK